MGLDRVDVNASALVDYIGVIRTKWRWLSWGVLIALFVTSTALVISSPLYRSTATLFVRTPGDVSSVLDGGDSYAQGRARTYAALANNATLASDVVSDLGLELAPDVLTQRIDASNRPGTALIDIAVGSPAPNEAQQTATVLIDEYARTVARLETVPGSLVPRAELVVIDPPSTPVRATAWDLPVAAVLFGAALTGLVLGAFGAVVTSCLITTARLGKWAP